jgi:hypothetical protein
MINIRLRGGDRIKYYVASLPKRIEHAGSLALERFAKRVQKSAKLRAPRWTGNLASKIKITKENKRKIVIRSNAPYAAAQETGYPPHYVSLAAHPELVRWWKDKYGGKSQPLSSGSGGSGMSGYFLVRKFKPHITPALEKESVKLPKIFGDAIEEALSRR